MRINNWIYLLSALFLLSCQEGAQGDDTPATPEEQPTPNQSVKVTIGDSSTHVVSPDLIGFNTVYCHHPDTFWRTTFILSEMQKMRTAYLRWPGGAVVNRYHWNNLNGLGWKDSWDEAYDPSSALDGSNFTDLDEYLAICKTTPGIKAMVGINMGSGMLYNRVDDGIAEAVALVKYCQAYDGVDVNLFYLDNEPYHNGANYKMSVAEYSEQIKLYVPAILEVNPDAKFIINWEKVRRNATWNLIDAVHEYVDFVDFHWYWNSGGFAKFDIWIDQRPMNAGSQWYEEGESYVEEIKFFNETCAERGYDVKISSLEWNVGTCDTFDDYPTMWQSAIMQAEMMMQFMNGGMELAVMWPIYWPANEGESVSRFLMNPFNNYSYNPSRDVLSTLSAAMSQNCYDSTSDSDDIYTLAVSTDATKSDLTIYLHSKSDEERTVRIKCDKYSSNIFCRVEPTDDTHADCKTSFEVNTANYDSQTGEYIVTIPAYSLCYLQLKN